MLVLGAAHKGAQAWFQVGPLQFQPSEIAKVAVDHRGRRATAINTAAISTPGGSRSRSRSPAVPMALVFVQHDLGTTLVIMRVRVRGARGRRASEPATSVVLLLLGVTAGRRGGRDAASVDDYQLDRIVELLSTSRPATDRSDQTQAAVQPRAVEDRDRHRWPRRRRAVQGHARRRTRTCPSSTPTSSSPWWGRSSASSAAPSLHRALRIAGLAPLAHRPAVVRLLRHARRVGVLAMFAFQVFENIGMTMGIMPITGIPLPFMSLRRLGDHRHLRRIGLVAERPHAPLQLNAIASSAASACGASATAEAVGEATQSCRETCQTCGRGSNRSWPGLRSPLATSEWSGAAVRPQHRPGRAAFLLIYPDTYEIGLPNQGLQILYEILNERPDAVAERAYAPWIDMERRCAGAGCRSSASTPTAPPPTSTSSPSTSRPSSSTRTC